MIISVEPAPPTSVSRNAGPATSGNLVTHRGQRDVRRAPLAVIDAVLVQPPLFGVEVVVRGFMTRRSARS